MAATASLEIRDAIVACRNIESWEMIDMVNVKIYCSMNLDLGLWRENKGVSGHSYKLYRSAGSTTQHL